MDEECCAKGGNCDNLGRVNVENVMIALKYTPNGIHILQTLDIPYKFDTQSEVAVVELQGALRV